MKPKTAGILGAMVGSGIVGLLMIPAMLTRDRTIAEQKLEIVRLRSQNANPTILSPRARVAEKPATKPEELRIDRRLWAHSELATDDRGEWVKAILQIEDRDRKLLAIEEMRNAMASGNLDDTLAALRAYREVASVEFDRTPFRPVIETLLEHDDPVVRGAAVQSLATLPKDEADLDRLIEMTDDPDPGVRQSVVGGLFWASERDLTGEAGAAVREILSHPDPPDRSWVDTLWGAALSTELEEQIVALARSEDPSDHQLAYYALYSCLSTQQNKGPACVDLLIERLSDQDSLNVGGRAAWGLGYGIQRGLGLEKRIADAALNVWRERNQPYLRGNLIRCLELYGDLSHAEALTDLANAPAIDGPTRDSLLKAAGGIRQQHGQ